MVMVNFGTFASPFISPEVLPAIEEVLNSKWLGQGQKTYQLEQRVRELLHVPYTIAVSHFSAAIRLALDLIGVKPDDEVLTIPQACTSTNHPILEQFAKPVFVDIQYLTGNMDSADIEHRITEKTKAIICSHQAGYPCDLDEIHNIAKRNQLPVIEDASEAFGALYKDRSIGTWSEFTCFSFHAAHQITSGEGGMLCVSNENDFMRATHKRWYGIDREKRKPNCVGYYDFDILERGYGYHLTDLASVIGLANLKYFHKIMTHRRHVASLYKQELKNISGITLLEAKPDRLSSECYFLFHVENRENFCNHLRSHGIPTSIVHERNDIYTVFGGERDDLPNLDRFSKTHIALPIHNQLTDSDIEYITRTVASGW